MRGLALDTNILLLDAGNLLTVGDCESIIVLPETVLDEIDSKKSGMGELAYQAREFGRMISRATKSKLLEVGGGDTVQELILDNQVIHIISLKEYTSVDATTPVNISNDNKIIEATLRYSEVGLVDDISFMTNDVMCGIRAGTKGLAYSDLKIVDKTDFELVKKLEVTPEQFSCIRDCNIKDIDPDYLQENFSYVFSSPDTNQTKLATIGQNGEIKTVSKEEEILIRRQELPPINSRQLLLSKAILDPSVNIVVCEAKAGSGKTAVALSNAMKLVGTNSPFTEIIYIRNTVVDLDKEEEVGFLPGLEEKFALYYEPLEDTLDAIARNKNSNSKLKGDDYEDKVTETISKLKNTYNISAMSTMGLRGRTLKNAVIIIDEFQNASQNSGQKVLTRVGDNCKVIMLGSNNQIDNNFITKYNNALSVVQHDCCTVRNDNIARFSIDLTKVVRSEITEWAEDMFSNSKY